MQVRAALSTMAALSPLQTARKLNLPSYRETLVRSPAVSRFWNEHANTLQEAWKEWDTKTETPTLDASLLHKPLREAVEAAWKDPAGAEDAVKKLFKEVAPGVYQIQWFDPDKIHVLRDYLQQASEAQIPTRAPYGILLNRNGKMMDPRSEGYLAADSFQRFYQQLLAEYMRPIGRLLYPEYMNGSDDSQTFGFSIEYQPTTEQGIRMHSDSSALTLNINMNLPGETWEGSNLLFPTEKEKHLVDFGPGVAVLHRGATLHAALPLTAGQRSNLVLWLYGPYGSVNREPQSVLQTPEERWSKTSVRQDAWAPF